MIRLGVDADVLQKQEAVRNERRQVVAWLYLPEILDNGHVRFRVNWKGRRQLDDPKTVCCHELNLSTRYYVRVRASDLMSIVGAGVEEVQSDVASQRRSSGAVGVDSESGRRLLSRVFFRWVCLGSEANH